jgi:hypothetical protein
MTLQAIRLLQPLLEIELPEWLAKEKFASLNELGFWSYRRISGKSYLIFPEAIKKHIELILGPIEITGEEIRKEAITAQNESYGKGEIQIIVPNEEHPDYYLLHEIQKENVEVIEVPIEALNLIWKIVCRLLRPGEMTNTGTIQTYLLREELELDILGPDGNRLHFKPLAKFQIGSEADNKDKFNGERQRNFLHGGYFPYYRGPVKILQAQGMIEMDARSNRIKRVSNRENLEEMQTMFVVGGERI